MCFRKIEIRENFYCFSFTWTIIVIEDIIFFWIVLLIRHSNCSLWCWDYRKLSEINSSFFFILKLWNMYYWLIRPGICKWTELSALSYLLKKKKYSYSSGVCEFRNYFIVHMRSCTTNSISEYEETLEEQEWLKYKILQYNIYILFCLSSV